MSEWPRVCQHSKCYGTATPATWKLEQPGYGVFYWCTPHAAHLGKVLKGSRNIWTHLREPVPAQPTSERVQP